MRIVVMKNDAFDLSYASSGLCEACVVETVDLSYASSEACVVDTIYDFYASWIYAGYTVYGLKYLTNIIFFLVLRPCEF